MQFNEDQKKQFDYQLDNHNHTKYEVDIEIDTDEILKGFEIHAKVLRPEVMSAMYLAKWLFFNNGIYKDKSVIDMGCGTGLQGIVAGLYGAKRVVFSDIAPEAVENTKANVEKFDLKNIEVVEGDLFASIKERADIIIFNHPFFSDETMEGMKVEKTMREQGKLIHRFFDDCKNFLNQDGIIIMPYYHIAGETNDPEIQAPEHNLDVAIRFRHDCKGGLQKGLVSIYELSFKK